MLNIIISSKDLTSAFSELKAKKVCIPGDIPNRILKIVHSGLHPSFENCFVSSFKLRPYFNFWKCALIQPLHTKETYLDLQIIIVSFQLLFI